MANDGGLFDKVRDFIKGNPDKAQEGLDKLSDVIDERTGGQHADAIRSGREKVGEALGLPAEDTVPVPGDPVPGDPTPAPAPTPSEPVVPTEPVRPTGPVVPDVPEVPSEPAAPPVPGPAAEPPTVGGAEPTR